MVVALLCCGDGVLQQLVESGREINGGLRRLVKVVQVTLLAGNPWQNYNGIFHI